MRAAQSVLIALGVCAFAPVRAQAPVPGAAKAACAKSVVLEECARSQASPARARLREQIERNARRLQARAELSPVAADLGLVIIEEQRLVEESDIEKFRATLTRPEYPLGRNTYSGTRADRDNFGQRFECGQSGELSWNPACANQPGRPASTHWMNGR